MITEGREATMVEVVVTSDQGVLSMVLSEQTKQVYLYL
jgi:hypothetical protein